MKNAQWRMIFNMIYRKDEIIAITIGIMNFAGALVVSVITPFLSLLAIPFFALKAFLKWIKRDQEFAKKEELDLKMVRTLSKALIPIIGYFWVRATENIDRDFITYFDLITTGVGAIMASAIAPFVSLLAVPFFAMKAFPKWIKYRTFYKMTLTNGTREKFGRVPGQDYTRWDGKAVVKEKTKKIIWAERMHELMDEYASGVKYGFLTFDEGAADCPFTTKEDAEWLDHEFTRKKKKEALDKDLRMLRAFSKALIPLIGVIWVLLTETGPGGASNFGCRFCMLMGIAPEDVHHWDSASAIDFHREILKKKLG